MGCLQTNSHSEVPETRAILPVDPQSCSPSSFSEANPGSLKSLSGKWSRRDAFCLLGYNRGLRYPMGFSGAAHSGSKSWWSASQHRHARGGECCLLRLAWRLPMAPAAEGLPALSDALRLLSKLAVVGDMGTATRQTVREAHGRNREPSAGIIDSQTVKTTEKGESAVMTGASASYGASATSS